MNILGMNVDNPNFIVGFIVAGILFTVLGFLIGKLRDIVFRAKAIRMILKKEFIIVSIVSRDGKTIRQVLTDVKNGMIKLGDCQWVVENSRIYRLDKQEQGFGLTARNIQYTEGVPVVYVSYADIKPLSFSDDTVEQLNPEAVASVLNAFIDNQIAKDLRTKENIKMMVAITAILCALAMIVGYMAWDNTNKILTTIEHKLPAPFFPPLNSSYTGYNNVAQHAAEAVPYEYQL